MSLKLCHASGQNRGERQRSRSKGIIPAKSGSPSRSGTRLESSHQKISLSGSPRLSSRNTGSACTTSPSELGFRRKIFKVADRSQTLAWNRVENHETHETHEKSPLSCVSFVSWF